MILSHPLHRLFGGSRALILEHLLEMRGPISVRQAAHVSGVAATTASSALQAMHEVGLVDRQDVGTSQLYRIVESHALVAPLRQVLVTARQVDEVVVRAIREAIDGVIAVWLYGSRARGEDRADSDADLLVLVAGVTPGTSTMDERTELADRLRQLVGIPVSLTVLPPPDAKDAARTFWRNVRRDAIALDGPGPHDLIGGSSGPSTRGRSRKLTRRADA